MLFAEFFLCAEVEVCPRTEKVIGAIGASLEEGLGQNFVNLHCSFPHCFKGRADPHLSCQLLAQTYKVAFRYSCCRIPAHKLCNPNDIDLTY